MVAVRSLTDDSDLERDLAQTSRVLSSLRDAHARLSANGDASDLYLASLKRQAEACERHLAWQRANLEAAR